MMAASKFTPYLYAIGLNVPLAILYNISVRYNVSLLLGILSLIGFSILLLLKTIRVSSNLKSRVGELLIILGSAIFWSMILLIFGVVNEKHYIVYDISKALVYIGIALLLTGIFITFISTKERPGT
jgi:hypothetical protein